MDVKSALKGVERIETELESLRELHETFVAFCEQGKDIINKDNWTPDSETEGFITEMGVILDTEKGLKLMFPMNPKGHMYAKIERLLGEMGENLLPGMMKVGAVMAVKFAAQFSPEPLETKSISDGPLPMNDLTSMDGFTLLEPLTKDDLIADDLNRPYETNTETIQFGLLLMNEMKAARLMAEKMETAWENEALRSIVYQLKDLENAYDTVNKKLDDESFSFGNGEQPAYSIFERVDYLNQGFGQLATLIIVREAEADFWSNLRWDYEKKGNPLDHVENKVMLEHTIIEAERRAEVYIENFLRTRASIKA
jgi:hypothetical protein